MRRISKAKRKPVKLNQEDFQEVKNLLNKFLKSMKNFDLKDNRDKLRSLENDFKFILK